MRGTQTDAYHWEIMNVCPCKRSDYSNHSQTQPVCFDSMSRIHLRCQISSGGFYIFCTLIQFQTLWFLKSFSMLSIDVGTRSVIEWMIQLVINTVRPKTHCRSVFEGQILSRLRQGLLMESRPGFICLVPLINHSNDRYMFSNTVWDTRAFW